MSFELSYHPIDFDLYKQDGEPLIDETNFTVYYDTPITAGFRVESDDENALAIFNELAGRVVGRYCAMAEHQFNVEHPDFNYIVEAGAIFFGYTNRGMAVKTRLNEEDSIFLMFLILGECVKHYSGLIECFSLSFSHFGKQYNVYNNPLSFGFNSQAPWLSSVLFLVDNIGPGQTMYGLYAKTNYGDAFFRDRYTVQNKSFGLAENTGDSMWIGSYLKEDVFLDEDEGAAVETVSLMQRFIYIRGNEDFELVDLREREETEPQISHVIERTGDAITYFGGIEFRNKNGVYLNDEIKCANFGAQGVLTAYNIPIVPPSLRDCGNHVALNNECVRALNKAFCNAGNYTLVREETTETDELVYNKFEINRTENGSYCFSLGEAQVAFSINPMPDSDNSEINPATRLALEFFVEAVSFYEKTENGEEVTVSIVPSRENPNSPRIMLSVNQLSQGEGDFNALKNSPDFNGSCLPGDLSLTPYFPFVIDEIEIYEKIKDAVMATGIAICSEIFKDAAERETEDMADALYPNKKLVRDESVIVAAAHLKNEFERTGEIPNLAIVGQAGTGKTTLVKRLAEKIFHKEALVLSPSDLKGPYVGHTEYKTLSKIADALKKDAIVFIDEAYELMTDRFGKEAVSILLPMMTGDRKEFDAQLESSRIEIDLGEKNVRDGFVRITVKGEVTVNFTFPPRQVPIWLAGYEDEIRVMITKNQGLYRRLKKLIISAPTALSLINQLRVNLNEQITLGTKKVQEKAKSLYKYFGFDNQGANGVDINYENLRPVRDFFGWGAQPQNSKYFASYAGVITFMNNCLDAIDFSKNLEAQINDIILKTKIDVKRQLAVVRKTAKKDDPLNGADSINVITDIDVRFSDLIGCDSQIAYMQSIIEMLVNKSVYENYNMTVPRGALMEGAPGTGKTFIAKAMAGELQERFQNEAPDKRFGFMAVSGAELGSRGVSYISSLFNTAEEYDACIMFIDEVDSIAKDRNHNPHYENYLELIKYMDGIEKSSNVFILAATNAPENLDDAFVRSGRIDKRLKFTMPDKRAREEFARRSLAKHLKLLEKKGKYAPKEDADGVGEIARRIAEKTQGYTTRGIENVINNAFVAYHQYIKCNDKLDNSQNDISGIFKNYPFIKFSGTPDSTPMSIEKDKNKRVSNNRCINDLYLFIDEEIEKARVGELKRAKREEKFSAEKNDDSCSATAIHEVGHAVVNLLLNIPIDVITTMPRGVALGYVAPAEQNLITKADYENQIRVCMGGRISEELTYGKDNISTGATQDMNMATHYARLMVEKFGFSDEFGFMMLSKPTSYYLGGEDAYVCSDAFREESDKAVLALLQRLYTETHIMLADKKKLIVALAKEVFEKESMTGRQFKTIFNKLNR